MKASIEHVIAFIPEILASTHSGLFMYDEEDHSSYCSPELYRLLNYADGAIETPAHLLSFIAGEQKETIQKAIEKMSHSPYQAEVRLNIGAGHYSWFTLSWHKLNVPSARHLCIITNIEEKRKKKLDALYSKLFFDKINRIARIGGWEINRYTRQRTWTAGIFYILDLDEKHQPDIADVYTRIDEPGRSVLQQAVEAVFEQKQSFDLEFSMCTYTNRQIYVRVKGEPVTDATGAVIKARGVFQDITESKKA